MFGEDRIRVIDKGAHADRPSDCAGLPGASASWDSVPGLIDCPPGLGGEVPGLKGDRSQAVGAIGKPGAETNSIVQPSSQSETIDVGGALHGVFPGIVEDTVAGPAFPDRSTNETGEESGLPGTTNTGESEGHDPPGEVPEGMNSTAEDQKPTSERSSSETASGQGGGESTGPGPPD